LAGCLVEVYRATLRQDPWPQILRALAAAVGADKAMFIRVDRTHPRDSVTSVMGIPEPYVAPLINRSLQQDPIWPLMLALPTESVFRTTELVPAADLHSAPLYRQIALPAGLAYGVGAILENDAQYFSVVGYLRSEEDFDEASKQVLAALLPHLQTASRISRRIAAGDAGCREALHSFDRAQQALVVLDRSGYAIYRNEIAERQLSNGSGVQLKLGRFLFDNIATQMQFEHAVRVAVGAPSGEGSSGPQRIRVPRPGSGRPCQLSVLPVSSWSDRALLPEGAGCMVLIFDEQDLVPLPVDRLTWLYRLTGAEARTCQALYELGSVEAAAERLKLTQHTVRSHLKAIYPKFGVSSQSQLMQRLVSAAHQSLTIEEGFGG
jgi:DNA-binding CsgD family transcriptional regulator